MRLGGRAITADELCTKAAFLHYLRSLKELSLLTATEPIFKPMAVIENGVVKYGRN